METSEPKEAGLTAHFSIFELEQSSEKKISSVCVWEEN